VVVVVLLGIVAGTVWRVLLCSVVVVCTLCSDPQALSSMAVPSSTAIGDNPRNEVLAAENVVSIMRAILFLGVAGTPCEPG
jgi:hypothetical protein